MAQKIHLIIQSLSGSFEGDFEPDQKLQDVIDKAFVALDIKPAPGDDWILTYDDVELSPQLTIADSKIPDKATLFLAPKEGGGGQ